MGMAKGRFLHRFPFVLFTTAQKYYPTEESGQNDQDEPGDNISQKRLKEQKKKQGRQKKEGRWSQKNLPLMQGQQ